MRQAQILTLLNSTVSVRGTNRREAMFACAAHTHKCSRSKSWQAQTLTLTLMSLTDILSDNSSGRETKSARPPVTCQQQQAHINMRKSSIERWGHTGNSPPSSDKDYYHIGLSQPLCMPVHLFSIEAVQSTLLWWHCFIRWGGKSPTKGFGFNLRLLEVVHSQITCCCCCCQQRFPPPVISFSCCLSRPTARSHGPRSLE